MGSMHKVLRLNNENAGRDVCCRQTLNYYSVIHWHVSVCEKFSPGGRLRYFKNH